MFAPTCASFTRWGMTWWRWARGGEKRAKKAVEGIAKALRKTVKDMDKPAAAKDWEAFMVAHASATSLVDDFFGYLKSASDIPDEL